MHPFFNTGNRVFFLIASWSLLTVSIVGMISTAIGAQFSDCLILFSPLYFLCLVFILPNYYICSGLPLQETSWFTLLGAQAMTLLVIVGLWALVGQGYVLFLNSSLEPRAAWDSIFDQALLLNIAIVVIQFEVIALVHYLYFAMEKTRNLEQVALKQKLLVSQAELQTLRATVHPHFLFNSLNTLANIALSAPEKAHRFCLLIAEFLRYSVAYSKKSSASLDEELDHIQNYLGIERERFGDRLKTNFEIDETLRSTSIPSLIIFPLVENAIKHGIDSCLEGGTLEIVARRSGSGLVLEISNPVDELGRKLKGTGHGLASVRQRLKTKYGEAAMVKTHRASGLFKVVLYLPIESDISTVSAQDRQEHSFE